MTVDDLIDRWQAAWSGRDPRAFGALCVPGVHYEDPVTAPALEGVDALGEHAGRLWQGFPDARVERTGERLSDGRFVAAPCRLTGTNRGSLDGLPPTGRRVGLHCVLYCELEREHGRAAAGPRLLRVRAFFDLYDAGRQLGVLPTRGTLGEKALLVLRGFGVRGVGQRAG